VSAPTYGSLAHVPSDRVTRLAGPTEEQLAVILDPPPDDAPVVIRYRVPTAPGSPHEIVDHVLARLEDVAVDLFPAWLPQAELLTTSTDFDLRVVREIAHRHAAQSTHFGPFLADVAEAALRGSHPRRRFEADVRVEGLTRIVADSYHRDRVALLVGADVPHPEDEQRRTALALEWLVDHGIGVWLTAAALPLVDRYPTWQLTVPGFLDALSTAASGALPAPLDYPALAGLPHPASAAEQALEQRLNRCAWAVGRTWNQEYASGSLVPPIRVDLMWPTERCVVEIDGPDHRGSLKYAADRRRDNGLTLDGFAVLRFTNEEIADDPARVLADIECLLLKKRTNEGNLP
jgi:very-short-patch-repair endonuclease